ncbi:High mobility group protein DSP1 [Portunus trituberculatus]|uniref:High mobility group protein DSP1 n=1 Tax=Portunus trituberculatus TaxID=210409 RepID=A0A5B7DP47_PORTR|nr:High mobility group protein DSP1 [Portunus trituberculatus]
MSSLSCIIFNPPSPTSLFQLLCVHPQLLNATCYTMTDKEKQRFYEMAEKDKQRYDTEMKGYKGPRQSRAARKRRNRKDPNAPKRALGMRRGRGLRCGRKKGAGKRGREDHKDVKELELNERLKKRRK